MHTTNEYGLRSLSRSEYLIVIVLAIAAILALGLKVRHGWDMDESYVLLLAEKIRSGEVMYKDLWDLHQNGSVPAALFSMPYVALNGTDGVALYLRVVAMIILLALAFFSFVILKKHYHVWSAFLSSLMVISVLPRAMIQLEFGLCTVVFSLTSMLLLLDIWKSEASDRWGGIALAGLCYGASVFIYPTTIISVPLFFCVILFMINRDPGVRIKYTILFWLMCALLASVFMIYILSHQSLSDFLRVVGELGKNSDHQVRFAAFHDVKAVKKLGIRLSALVIAPIIIYCVFRKRLKYRYFIFYIYAVEATLIILIPNLTGLRPSGPYGLLERYILFVILAGIIFAAKGKDKPLTWTLFVGGIAVYLGTLMGSALGFNENALFLEAGIIASVLFGAEQTAAIEERNLRILALVSMLIFTVGVVFSNGYFTRINFTVPANITECRTMLDFGPFKGIYVKEDQKSDFESHIKEIIDNSDVSSLNMYLGYEPIYNFFFDGDTTAAQYNVTSVPNVQWTDFYTEFGHELPDRIFIDKARYKKPEKVLNYDFGSIMETQYSLNSEAEVDEFYIYDKITH